MGPGDIEAILSAGRFGALEFGEALRSAAAGGRLWSEDEVAALAATASDGAAPRIEVADETTASAVARLGGVLGVLVSASGTEPGGGLARSVAGQEEDLCATSGWWACARAIPAFHDAHRAAEPLCNSGVVASFPDVPFFATAAGALPAVIRATMVAAAAPDARGLTLSGQAAMDLGPALTARVRGQLAVFRALGLRRLVLAAFGCGAYGNDPRDVALTYRAALVDGGFGGAFDHVVFAISSGPRSGIPALSAFHRVFPG